MNPLLVEQVLGRLGVGRPEHGQRPDLDGLRRIYGAWCAAVPFDNVLKLIHAAEGRGWPLPGATSEDFFASWLEHGTGGTCWAGNGALHDLLDACGFDVSLAIATMLPSPDTPGPNHGSVVVTFEGRRWIADASILSDNPIEIVEAGGAPGTGFPRLEWIDGSPAIIWLAPVAAQGFPCRIDRIGAERDEWDERHERTARWSPFNYALNVRTLRGPKSLCFLRGQRFAFTADGRATVVELDRAQRDAFLTEEIGIAADVVGSLPDDREIPPRPAA
jgi:N-hydroxyarylamine O-acetyltransferase